jgi:phospholipid/cholesterol/gamma-HCH transport system substrate-binding protein
VRVKAHPRAIGAFVLGAVALLLLAITLLSSESWFVRKDRFSLFFPGSIKGLSPGAAVTFRGVKVGQVIDIKAVLTGRDNPLIQIEVAIEIRSDVVESPPGAPPAFAGSSREDFAKGLLGRGIRARLLSASLLTGQRYVDLDFLPQEPARFAGLRPRYPELPTTPTAIERFGDRADEFLAKVADLPLADMLEDVREAIRAARQLLESSDLREVFGRVNGTTRRLDATLADLHSTLGAADKTLGTVGSEASLTGAEARQSLESLRATLSRAEKSVATIEGAFRGTDDARVTATHALEEMTRTMQALRNLVDYIQTHPEAVVLGKERAKEEK